MLCLTSELQAPIYRVQRHPLNFKFHQPPWLLPMFKWIFMELKWRFGSYLGCQNRSIWKKLKIHIGCQPRWSRPRLFSGHGHQLLSPRPRPLKVSGRGHRPFSAQKNHFSKTFQNVPNPFPHDFVTSKHLLGVKNMSPTVIYHHDFVKSNLKCVTYNIHIIG